MPIFWARRAISWGSRSRSSLLASASWRAESTVARCSSEVAAKADCCIEVLKSSSPTTPPSSSTVTRLTNGTFAARVRATGTTLSRARSTAAPAMRGIRLLRAAPWVL